MQLVAFAQVVPGMVNLTPTAGVPLLCLFHLTSLAFSLSGERHVLKVSIDTVLSIQPLSNA